MSGNHEHEIASPTPPQFGVSGAPLPLQKRHRVNIQLRGDPSSSTVVRWALWVTVNSAPFSFPGNIHLLLPRPAPPRPTTTQPYLSDQGSGHQGWDSGGFNNGFWGLGGLGLTLKSSLSSLARLPRFAGFKARTQVGSTRLSKDC